MCIIIKMLENDYLLNFIFENINNHLKKIIMVSNRNSVVKNNRIEAVEPSSSLFLSLVVLLRSLVN